MIFDVGAAARPHPHEHVCGDATVVVEEDWGIKCVIVDGAGHGPKAHDVAVRLSDCAQRVPSRDPVECLRRMHDEAVGSVGAVSGVFLIERSSGIAHYAAVGNTAAVLFGRQGVRFISQAGLLGERMRSARVQVARLSPGDIAVLHTDGICTLFEDERWRALHSLNAQPLASSIVAGLSKPYDDAACIVVRVLHDS